MKTVEIKCDACGGDLTDAGAMPTYRLVLSAEAVANSGSIIYSVAVSPDIDRSHHFCGLACLDHWRGRELHRKSLWDQWWQSWKEQNGIKHPSPFGDGRFTWSFPGPPDDVHGRAKDEIDVAALAAFPLTKPPHR